jgi:hypothetical protein
MKRTIIAEGDANHVVTRTASKFAAKATIRTETGEELVLWVDRDGAFSLYRHSDDGTYNKAVELVSGQL